MVVLTFVNYAIMIKKKEKQVSEIQAGYSDLEFILALIVCSLVSGILGVLIGIYIKL